MSSNPQTVYLFKNLNNYFNRKLVLNGIRTIDEIETNKKLVAIKDNINVSIGNGLSATLPISFREDEMIQYNNALINGDPSAFPDYAIIKMQIGNKITISRWFIIDSNKLSFGNFSLTLQRDVVADYYEEIRDSMFFLEKGFVEANDPLIFNSEEQSFNQIKKSEILIKDNSKCGWIVGYLAKQDEDGNPYSITANIPALTITEDFEYDDLPLEIAEALDTGTAYGRMTGISMVLDIYNDDYYCRAKNYFNIMGQFKNSNYETQWAFYNFMPIGNAIQQYGNVKANSYFKCTHNALGDYHISDGIVKEFYGRGIGYHHANQFMTNCSNYLYNQSNYAPSITSYDGKIIKLDSGSFVRIHVKQVDDATIKPTISDNNNLQSLLKSVIPLYPDNPQPSNYWWEYNRDPKTGDVEVSCMCFEITQEPLRGDTVSITIPTTRNACVDAPYDMFAIPYGGLNESGSKEESLRIAYGLSEALGSYLYDLQLLPYCPAQNFIDNIANADMTAVWSIDLTEDYDYVVVEDSDQEEITRIIFPQQSKQNFIINKWTYKSGLYIDDYMNYEWVLRGYENESIGTKVLDQTYIFRFASPNYASLFEFSIAKNKNVVDYITVNLNYKPYTPFIRVAPNFQGIYGAEYTDYRGLICGGDYSLAMISNAWTQYEINNKNYQLMFDRQIQHLGITQQIETEQQVLKSFNILPQTLASMFGGSYLGGSLGAVAGGITGLGTSFVNQAMQGKWLDMSQKETKSYLTDNFNYTLGNIKALPNTLTKVSALNEVNKIFPFIEVYEATEQERNLFANKLHYNGMTVNKIVGLGAYIDSLPNQEVFIKGQLIRMSQANTDSHITYQIYNELAKGIYIDKGDYTG